MKQPWTLRLLHGLTIVATGWFLALCVAHSQAGVNIFWRAVTVYGGAAILVSWLVLLSTSAAVRSVRLSLRHAPAGAVILAAIMLVFGQPPNPLFRARFELSRSRFAAAAEHCRKHSSCDLSRVGLFPVRRSYVVRDQVRFMTTPCGLVDSCGVVYSPVAIPPRFSEDHYTSLGGGWYHIHESF
jgi:hypothetical protein